MEDNATISGNITNSGTITATDNAFDVDRNANISGAITNSGTITAGDNAFDMETNGNISGGITNSGSITAGIDAFQVDGSTISGGVNNSGTITGGTNAFNITGAGAAFTIANSGLINGNVILNTSTLQLNGLTGRVTGAVTGGVSSTVTVNGTFTTENTFSVDNFAINAGGRLNIGHGVTTTSGLSNAGTLAVASGVNATVTGNYTQAAGGNFEVNVSAADNFGTLAVTGTADLSASGLVTVNEPGLLTAGTVQDVLTATTLIAGTLTTSSSGNLFYSATALRDGNTIDLVIERDQLAADLVANAGLPFAGGAAQAVDNLLDAGGGSTDINNVLGELSSLPTNGEAANAIAQLVPVLAGRGTIAVTQAMDATMGMVRSRFSSNNGGTRSGAAGDDSRYERGPLWLKPFGAYADQDTRSGTPGFEADTIGIGLGGDVEFNDRLVLGAAVAWSDTEVDGDTLSSNRLDAETYQLVVYSDYALNETDFVESYAVAGWNDNETRRQLSVGGLTRQARGDYNSFFTRIYTGLGRHYHTSDSWTFAPVVNLRYTYIDEDSYIEKGAGSLNLAVDDNDADSLILGLDGVATYRFGDNQGYTLTLRTGIGFDVLTDETAVTSTFAGGGGAFTTTGAEPDEFTYRAGIGFNAAPTDRVSVHLDYEFEGRSDYQSHGGSLNVRWQF